MKCQELTPGQLSELDYINDMCMMKKDLLELRTKLAQLTKYVILKFAEIKQEKEVQK
jgi:hypothetical protein